MSWEPSTVPRAVLPRRPAASLVMDVSVRLGGSYMILPVLSLTTISVPRSSIVNPGFRE
jgi:hypothetical protein